VSARSVYGAAERARLEGLANQITAATPASMDVLGPAVADNLRRHLPDLDDVTIGRVLVVIGTECQGLFMEAEPAVLWAGFTAAGLQMTEAEWMGAE